MDSLIAVVAVLILFAIAAQLNAENYRRWETRQKIRDVSRRLGKLTIAMTSLGRASYRAQMEFDSACVRVAFSTGQPVETVKEKARLLARYTVMSPTEAAYRIEADHDR